MTSVALANETHNLLLKLQDDKRNKIFEALLRKNHEPCDSAVKNFFQGMDQLKTAFWNVTCQNKKSYLIQVKADKTGSTIIMDCDALKVFTGKECFKKFEAK